MPEEIVTIKVFSNETAAAMAQQLIEDAGIMSFVFKDDAGGMEPHLQRTMGVRVAVNRVDAEQAQEILHTLENSS
jgi:Putative prokaryotic signal transducing protein